MKNLFLPYALALLAKEKGFNEPCFKFYSSSSNIGDDNFSQLWFAKILDKPYNCDFVEASDLTNSKSCLAPMFQQIIDWFREEHDMVVEACYSTSMDNWNAKNVICGEQWNIPDKMFQSYYEAINFSIEEAFKLIK